MLVLNRDVKLEICLPVRHRYTGTKAVVKSWHQDERDGLVVRVSTYIAPVIPELFELDVE